MNSSYEEIINDESNLSGSVVEEKIIKKGGDIEIRKYYIGHKLGEGSSSDYFGLDSSGEFSTTNYPFKYYEFSRKDNNKIFVTKIISKADLNKGRNKWKLIAEIKIHKSLHHPQILNFEHFFEDTEKVYILLEMFNHKQSLYQLLKRRKRLTELEVQCYIVQLIKALKYLHFHRVIHRGLKLENLFLTDKMELKVGNFDLATKLDFDGERKRTVCGPPNYIAPEILDGKYGHSYEVDIWALGVIIYSLIIGKLPFETRDVKTTYKRIKMNAWSFPENAKISEAAKDLISQILVLEPFKRPSLDKILTHDFFKLGTSIPKLLPSSTLCCAPSLSYIKQFMPDVGKDGIVNKPLTTTKLVDTNSEDEYEEEDADSEDEYEEEDADSEDEYDEKGDPNLKGPDIWVAKWVDYSSKYGLGYLLNNGYCGVFFNDSSKMILNPTTRAFYYIPRYENKNELISYHNLDDYPKELQKNVTLLNHFKTYLEGDSNPSEAHKSNQETTTNENKEDKSKPFIYIKKWMRTRHAIMFRLSNKIVQVNFQDKTEIILSSESRVVTYVNKNGERMTYQLINALKMADYEMTKRLKYTKDILTHMLTMNQLKKSQISQNNNINHNNIEENEYNDEKNIVNIKINTKNISEEKPYFPIIFHCINPYINYAIVCDNSDNKFTKVEQELFKEYPELNKKKIFYLCEGNIIDRNGTLKENKIKNNAQILINF